MKQKTTGQMVLGDSYQLDYAAPADPNEAATASLTTVKYSQVTFAPVTSLGEDAVVYDAAKTPFSILRKGTSGTTTTLTFSVKSTITDFTIKGGQDMDFTYDGEQAGGGEGSFGRAWR